MYVKYPIGANVNNSCIIVLFLFKTKIIKTNQLIETLSY